MAKLSNDRDIYSCLWRAGDWQLCCSSWYRWHANMLKVSKSQKQIILFSFLPKNEQKTFILVARILG